MPEPYDYLKICAEAAAALTPEQRLAYIEHLSSGHSLGESQKLVDISFEAAMGLTGDYVEAKLKEMKAVDETNEPKELNEADEFVTGPGTLKDETPVKDEGYKRRLAEALKGLLPVPGVSQEEIINWASEDYDVTVEDLREALAASGSSLVAAPDDRENRPLPKWRKQDLYRIKRFWNPYIGKEIVLQLYDRRLATGILVSAEVGFIVLDQATVKSVKNQVKPQRVNIDRMSIAHFHFPCEVEKLEEGLRENMQKFILDTVRYHLKHVGMKGLLGVIARGLKATEAGEQPAQQADVQQADNASPPPPPAPSKVWHWHSGTGRPACGVEKPNQGVTDQIDRVTCPECLRIHSERTSRGGGN